MDEMSEAWQILLDFPDYAVSNIGRVMRATDGRGGTYAGKILKQRNDKDGYKQIHLCKNKKAYNKRVHRLVMQAFTGPCPEGHVVNHMDGVKDNNNWLNLEYVTRQGNEDHARKAGLTPRGRRQHLVKLTEKDVFRVVLLEVSGMRQRDIAKKFGVCYATVNELLAGVSWSWLTGIKRKKKRVY